MESPLTPREIEEFFEGIKKDSLEEYEYLLKSGGCNEDVHAGHPYMLLTLAMSNEIQARLGTYLRNRQSRRELYNLKHF